MSVRNSKTRSGVRTAIAIVLLAIMLFPVYWMLNISLQSTGGTLATSFFPTQSEPERLPDRRFMTRVRTWSRA